MNHFRVFYKPKLRVRRSELFIAALILHSVT